jgi:hypothetical protein
MITIANLLQVGRWGFFWGGGGDNRDSSTAQWDQTCCNLCWVPFTLHDRIHTAPRAS